MTLRASRVASAASCLPGSEKKPIVQNYTLKVSTKRNDDENTDSFSAPKNWKTKNCKFPFLCWQRMQMLFPQWKYTNLKQRPLVKPAESRRRSQALCWRENQILITTTYCNKSEANVGRICLLKLLPYLKMSNRDPGPNSEHLCPWRLFQSAPSLFEVWLT